MGNIKNLISKFWTESPSTISSNQLTVQTEPSSQAHEIKIPKFLDHNSNASPLGLNQSYNIGDSTPKNSFRNEKFPGDFNSSLSNSHIGDIRTPLVNTLNPNMNTPPSRPSVPGSFRKTPVWMSPARAQRLLDSLDSYNKVETSEIDSSKNPAQKNINIPNQSVQSKPSKPFFGDSYSRNNPSPASLDRISRQQKIPESSSKRISSLSHISSTQSLARMIQQNHAKRILQRFNLPDPHIDNQEIFVKKHPNISYLENVNEKLNGGHNSRKRNSFEDDQNNQKRLRVDENGASNQVKKPNDILRHSKSKKSSSRIALDKKRLIEIRRRKQKIDEESQKIQWRFSARFICDNADELEESFISSDDESLIRVPPKPSSSKLTSKQSESLNYKADSQTGPKHRPFFAPKSSTSEVDIQAKGSSDPTIKDSDKELKTSKSTESQPSLVLSNGSTESINSKGLENNTQSNKPDATSSDVNQKNSSNISSFGTGSNIFSKLNSDKNELSNSSIFGIPTKPQDQKSDLNSFSKINSVPNPTNASTDSIGPQSDKNKSIFESISNDNNDAPSSKNIFSSQSQKSTLFSSSSSTTSTLENVSNNPINNNIFAPKPNINEVSSSATQSSLFANSLSSINTSSSSTDDGKSKPAFQFGSNANSSNSTKTSSIPSFEAPKSNTGNGSIFNFSSKVGANSSLPQMDSLGGSKSNAQTGLFSAESKPLSSNSTSLFSSNNNENSTNLFSSKTGSSSFLNDTASKNPPVPSFGNSKTESNTNVSTTSSLISSNDPPKSNLFSENFSGGTSIFKGISGSNQNENLDNSKSESKTFGFNSNKNSDVISLPTPAISFGNNPVGTSTVSSFGAGVDSNIFKTGTSSNSNVKPSTGLFSGSNTSSSNIFGSSANNINPNLSQGNGILGTNNIFVKNSPSDTPKLNPTGSVFGLSSGNSPQLFSSTSGTNTPQLTASTVPQALTQGSTSNSITNGNSGFSVSTTSGLFSNSTSTQSSGFGSNSNLFGINNNPQTQNTFQTTLANPTQPTTNSFGFGTTFQQKSINDPDTSMDGSNKRGPDRDEPASKKSFNFGSSLGTPLMGSNTNSGFGAPNGANNGGIFGGNGFGSSQQQPTSTFNFGSNPANTGNSTNSIFGNNGQSQGFGINNPTQMAFGQSNSSTGSPSTLGMGQIGSNSLVPGRKFEFGAGSSSLNASKPFNSGTGMGFQFGTNNAAGPSNPATVNASGSGFSVGSAPSSINGRKIARPRKIR
ncbi:hypothetical protein AYI68_g2759 [Smittium mucronatum]|uniref:Uncharacterized protein n=1 Tax=Smittium mucronatum TaxID=133383 RepID=A0A1R0H1U0_9FUNG|nr:hypothetical protein AYI68_g2759 [Smittium mucronatum]